MCAFNGENENYPNHADQHQAVRMLKVTFGEMLSATLCHCAVHFQLPFQSVEYE